MKDLPQPLGAAAMMALSVLLLASPPSCSQGAGGDAAQKTDSPARLAARSDPAAGSATLEKRIFAHFMACYPAASAAPPYHRSQAYKVRHDGLGRADLMGDRWRNWPLLPAGMKVSLEEDANLEIRRAMRAGLDGFAMDAWAGGDNAKACFDAFLKVAKENDYPFEITICIDPHCLPRSAGGIPQAVSDCVREVIAKHGDNPKLARRDGKVLIFGYHSIWPAALGGASEANQLAPWKDQPDFNAWTDANYRCTPAGWRLYRTLYDRIEKLAGTGIYWHFGMGAFFHGSPRRGEEADLLMPAAAGAMAKLFPAVGGFLPERNNDAMAAVVRIAGAEWSEPMYFQYENAYWGGNSISRGTDILRSRWQAARENQSTLIQFVTWNDYTENTCLAPAYETRYAILDLNEYFIRWWKTGQPPRTDRDRIYVTFKKYAPGATMWPFRRRQWDANGVLEVLTILTAPATVRAPGRDAQWDAPAGLSFRQLPLTPGPVAAEVVRGGKVVARVESPDRITDRPYRPQNGMSAISTEFERNWRADFGDAPPYLHGEYGDDDGDGLPNWFEMYWFGKFLDYSTDTVADADADGDGDGRTNLQEYLDRTDPTRPPPAYGVGWTWDMTAINRRYDCYNPDPDANSINTWEYLYRPGRGGRIPHDGNFVPLSNIHGTADAASGGMIYFNPKWNQPGWEGAKLGFIARRWGPAVKADDGSAEPNCVLILRPRTDSLVAVAWRSPVAGRVRLDIDLDPVESYRDANDPVTFSIECPVAGRQNEVLYRKVFAFREAGKISAPDIAVRPGEQILLVADSQPGTELSSIAIRRLTVTLTERK